MLRIFIGYDPAEIAAYHVLSHSILTRSSQPVSITPLVLSQLPETRRGSTEFAFSRFLVPWLCDYEGQALFMDCDILCLGDIAEVFDSQGHAVSVVKHDYRPQNETKFLGNAQLCYPRKCWSAVMLFDNSKCRELTPEYVKRASGAELHQFAWTQDIGSLDEKWQYIVGHSKTPDPKLIHFTEGGPWFPEYRGCEYSAEWFEERAAL